MIAKGEEEDRMNRDYEQDEHGYAEAVPVPVPPPSNPSGSGDGELMDEENGESIGGTNNMPPGFEKAKSAVFANGGYPLLVFMASVVLMIAASSECSKTNYCGGSHGYAVAGGVISMVVSFIYLFLDRRHNLDDKPRLGMTIFLFLWWVVVAGVTTFPSDAPFRVPGNGYFAAWGGLVGTLFMLTNQVGKAREAVDKFASLGPKYAVLIVGSLVVMFAAVGMCTNGCSGTEGYGIAAGCISFVVVAIRIAVDKKLDDKAAKGFTLFIIVWWIAALIVLTFVGPFLSVGNGYFGCWACLIASILMMNPH